MPVARLGVAIVVLVGVLATAATAQAPVPTVAVAAGPGSISVTPSGPIAAGPTRFSFRRSGRGEIEAYLATLRAGVTVDDLREALGRGPDAALGLVFLEAGATPSDPPRSVTVDLRPNTTYVAISIAGRRSDLTSFTTGAPSGAVAPAPDARVRMFDYGFRGPRTLPRSGLIRVQNQGAAFHFALGFPLRPGVDNRQVGRAFRRGSDRLLGRIVAGPPFSLQSLISPGTTNDNAVRFPRRGRYAFVCFFGEHNRLGMYKVFRVR
ncbi:MAG TPA: hypothetical protein VE270_08620 [Thermoleophilaceae bacterium]|nr:hypothetical protein [Thermoleophilaceae bacterium]